MTLARVAVVAFALFYGAAEAIAGIATGTLVRYVSDLPLDATNADAGRSRWSSRIWVLAEALAYAGASIDPASALAAQRFARIRDEERSRRRAGNAAA